MLVMMAPVHIPTVVVTRIIKQHICFYAKTMDIQCITILQDF